MALWLTPWKVKDIRVSQAQARQKALVLNLIPAKRWAPAMHLGDSTCMPQAICNPG